MKSTKKAEALSSVLITVTIIAIVGLGMFSILSVDQDISNTFNGDIYEFLLRSNAKNIEKKVFFGDLEDQQDFYLQKDTNTKTYTIELANDDNTELSYIDRLGNPNPNPTNLLTAYKRTYTKINDVLRAIITPEQINNPVFHFDARRLNTSYSDGQSVNEWNDISGNGLDAQNIISASQPTFKNDGIKSTKSIQFDGSSRMFLARNNRINTGTFHHKSFFFVIRTGANINDLGVIYEQGNFSSGYNLYIKDKKIHFSIFNESWKNNQTIKNILALFGIDLGEGFTFTTSSHEIYPSQTYFVVVTQNSPYDETSPNLGKNNIQIYLNGELQGETYGVPPMPSHVDISGVGFGIGIGGIAGNTSIENTSYSWVTGDHNFSGYIGEFGSWNQSLSPNEVKGLSNYLDTTWIGSKQKIELIEAGVQVSPLFTQQ